MKCDDCRDLILTDFLDGELSGEARRELMAHVDGCDSCRALMRTASRDLVEPFRSLPRVTPPETLWKKIATELDLDPDIVPGPLTQPTEGGSGASSPFAPASPDAASAAPRPRMPLRGLLLLVSTALVLVIALSVWWLSGPPTGVAVSPRQEVPTKLSLDAVADLIATYRDDPAFARELERLLRYPTALEEIFPSRELSSGTRLSK